MPSYGEELVSDPPVPYLKKRSHGLNLSSTPGQAGILRSISLNSIEYIFLLEMKQVSVSAHSAGTYTATLLVMVSVVKGGGPAPPTLTSLG